MDIIDKEALLQLLRLHGLGPLMTGARLGLERSGISEPEKREVTEANSLFSAKEKLEFADSFEKMGLPHSAELLRQWAEGKGGLPKTEILMPELQRRIEGEIRSVVWLHIPRERAKYYASTGFGEEVSKAFPSSKQDIEEAGKCYALGRYTACVFHLMRALEVALRAMAKTLNDPRLDPTRNPSWDSILKKCREELEKERSKRTPQWVAQDIFFSGAATRLMGVKDAWRNPTIHIDIDYNDESALDVWNHVCAFMRHLAANLSE